jgi:hypothetical protein
MFLRIIQVPCTIALINTYIIPYEYYAVEKNAIFSQATIIGISHEIPCLFAYEIRSKFKNSSKILTNVLFQKKKKNRMVAFKTDGPLIMQLNLRDHWKR